MAKKKAIIHRYDNLPDILAVEKNGCSEVYKRSRDDDFELVIVVPTTRARTQKAVVADAASRQYRPPRARPWPGRPDAYPVRVDVRNVRYTTLSKVRDAMKKAGESWAAAWVIKSVMLEENDLF
ncbi:hypothetical protein SVA_0879 [Sulfurifustis variabilis]|uniref:Uncharacterized protein n=1 Tax=Sulfurifustis variabilis TaxID=1675686 RepID=A0A1B4V1T3_9GAMM|nr:hypothetical protein [Sulfurifustis variabilis]BAU47458.1 hypothetical protein SVA_0879 [Sulfurifustis variabilis]